MFPWALIAGGVWFVMALLFVVSLCLAARMEPEGSIPETHQLITDETILSQPDHSSFHPEIAVIESPEPIGTSATCV
jgi:hypothetical protein